MTHRFKVGDLVRIDKVEGRTSAEVLANRNGNVPLPEGLFEVVRQMPAIETGELQYRVKSSSAGGQERVVRESQISPAKA